MLCAMPTHSAAKLYVVQVRSGNRVGASSALAYGLFAIAS